MTLANKCASKPLLEIACFNMESAVIAAQAGADRIELCRDYASGGLSPYPEALATLKCKLSIPVYVMIRPHAESFYYSDADFKAMKCTISMLDERGADGYVFGILNSAIQEGSGEATPVIDVARNKELVKLAKGKPCTFHRAFDLIPESQWDATLKDIVECGFTSILTSGGPSGSTAIECVDQLESLVHARLERLEARVKSDDRLPQIIVGGGVRAANLGILQERIRAPAFHSAALALSSAETVSHDEVEALRAVLDKAK